MVNKYFSVDLVPDIVDGDVSDVYGGDGVDLAPNDLIADWIEVDVPKGVNLLKSISMIVNNSDGGASIAATDFVLLFAKSINGVAPPSIKGNGFGDVAVVTNGDIRRSVIGGVLLEGTTDSDGGHIPVLNDFAGFTMYQVGQGSGGADAAKHSASLPMVLDLDPDSGTNVGYDKLYVALLCNTGTHSFETNVLADYSSGAPTADSTTTIVVKTTDPRLLFSPGDTIYNGTKHASTDVAIGVVKSLTAASIVLEANNAVAIADEDEIINGNPIRIKLGFER